MSIFAFLDKNFGKHDLISRHVSLRPVYRPKMRTRSTARRGLAGHLPKHYRAGQGVRF